MADTESELRELAVALRAAGAEKLAWRLEQHSEGSGIHWEGMMQAANEMGAPVQLRPEVEQLLREAIRSGKLGGRQPGSWVMDCTTGDIGRPQPRTGDGASAPGVTERKM
jgi:hypothetical protein